MARSRITEDQVKDQDFASEIEMLEHVSTVSGSLRSYLDDNFVKTDGSRGFISTVSGVTPIEPYHLSTKFYVDSVTVSGANSFVGLNDTPSSYTGKAGYVLIVSSVENSVEFAAPGSFNIDGGYANTVYGGTPAIDGGNAT